MKIWKIKATVTTVYASIKRPTEAQICDACAEEIRHGAGMLDADTESCEVKTPGGIYGTCMPWYDKNDADAETLGDLSVDQLLACE